MSIGKLGGFPLLGSAENGWTLRPGVRPCVETFEMEPQHAQSLFNQTALAKKPTRLELTNEVTNKTETYSNLWVLRLAPGENKNIMRVVVADRRWMWGNALVCRGYNIRRHVGVKRAIANDQPANNPVVPKYAYAKWSLKNDADPPASKWTPEDVIRDVFKEVATIEQAFAGTSFAVNITDGVGTKIKALPVEDLEVRDQGDQAIARVLSYFPEAEVTLDKDGTVIVYSRVDGKDKDLVQMLGPEIVGGGHFEFISNAGIRPQYMEIYFQIEAELRMDFNENAAAAGSTVVEDTDDLRLDNVAPIPDYQLPLSGGNADTTYAQGTWLTVDQLFNLWGAFPDPFGGGGRQLDHKLVQKAFMPFNDLWSKMGLIGSFSPDANWGQRLSVVHGHYRQTFRFNSRIMDKILAWKTYRVATIDRTSGQRAPAMVWGDYSFLNNVRSCFKTRAAASHAYAFNKYGYPNDGAKPVPNPVKGGPLDSTASPCPARVKMEDHDQGIVHVEYYDPWGVYMTFFPSAIDSATMPNGDIGRKGTKWVMWDSIGEPGQPLPHLSASFNMALIITAIPASPNNLNRYFKLKVNPEDVKDIVPGGTDVIKTALGPPLRVLISPGVETARVQWLDSRAADIKRIFGLKTVGDGPPNLEGLVVNKGDPKGGPAGGGAASLWDLARAEAARTYALYADRYLGTGTGDFRPGMTPDGFVEQIRHSIGTDGKMTTQVALKEKLDPFPLEALLSSGTRAVLNRQVML